MSRVDIKRGDRNISWDYVYEEDGHTWELHWDPHDDGTSAYARFDAWKAPAGESIDAPARERILDAVWPVIRDDAGVMGIFDYSDRLRCPLAARWNRGGGGFLLDVNDGGEIDYFELGRTMRIAYERSGINLAVIAWPAVPRWCEPDVPLSTEDAERIQERLQSARSDDMRYGNNIGWRITLAERPGPEAGLTGGT